jgi:hypothetical protein
MERSVQHTVDSLHTTDRMMNIRLAQVMRTRYACLWPECFLDCESSYCTKEAWAYIFGHVQSGIHIGKPLRMSGLRESMWKLAPKEHR